MSRRASQPIPVLVALLAAGALALGTVGADFVDLLTCGHESEACGWAPAPRSDDEGTCDHCPTCMVSHGHMLSLAERAAAPTPDAGRANLTPVPSHLHPRIAARDIFHPPIA